MKIWSKGLGNMVLHMDFRKYYVELDKGNLVIKGKITEPVFWELVITIKKDDIPGLMNIAFKPRFILHLVKNIGYLLLFFFEKIFRRKKFKHPEKNIEIRK